VYHKCTHTTLRFADPYHELLCFNTRLHCLQHCRCQQRSRQCGLLCHGKR